MKLQKIKFIFVVSVLIINTHASADPRQILGRLFDTGGNICRYVAYHILLRRPRGNVYIPYNVPNYTGPPGTLNAAHAYIRRSYAAIERGDPEQAFSIALANSRIRRFYEFLRSRPRGLTLRLMTPEEAIETDQASAAFNGRENIREIIFNPNAGLLIELNSAFVHELAHAFVDEFFHELGSQQWHRLINSVPDQALRRLLVLHQDELQVLVTLRNAIEEVIAFSMQWESYRQWRFQNDGDYPLIRRSSYDEIISLSPQELENNVVDRLSRPDSYNMDAALVRILWRNREQILLRFFN